MQYLDKSLGAQGSPGPLFFLISSTFSSPAAPARNSRQSLVPFEGRIARAQQKLVEFELKQAMEIGSAYLSEHPGEQIKSLQQEPDSIRLMQVDISAGSGSITMQYIQHPGSRRRPVMVKMAFDEESAKAERVE